MCPVNRVIVVGAPAKHIESRLYCLGVGLHCRCAGIPYPPAVTGGRCLPRGKFVSDAVSGLSSSQWRNSQSKGSRFSVLWYEDIIRVIVPYYMGT